MKKRIEALFVFVFIFSVYGFAEEQRHSFGLKEAIEYALKNSPDIKEADAVAKEAGAGAIKAKSSLLPKISLGLSYMRYQERHVIVPGMIGTEQRFDNEVFSGKLKASWMITDFGKDFYSYQSAKKKYLASAKGLERRRSFVIYAVANTYFNIVSVDKFMASLNALRKSVRELQRRAKLYLEEGKIARIDLLKINVRLSEIDSEIANLKAKKAYLLGLLAQEIGYNGELEVKDSIGEINMGKDVKDLSFHEELKKAIKNREDLAMHKFLVESASFALTSSKRSYFPQIKAVGGAGEFSGSSDDARFSDGDKWEDDYWAGIEISLPVFDSGLRKGSVLIAKAQYDKRKAQEKKAVLGICREVKKSLADIVSAQTRLGLARSAQKEATETMRIENLKYKEGKGVINDVLDAEAALRKAEFLYCSAMADYNSSVFELMLTEGVLARRYGELIPAKSASRYEKSNSKQ